MGALQQHQCYQPYVVKRHKRCSYVHFLFTSVTTEDKCYPSAPKSTQLYHKHNVSNEKIPFIQVLRPSLKLRFVFSIKGE